MPSGQLVTAGECVAVHSDRSRGLGLVERAAGVPLAATGAIEPSVVLELQHGRTPFELTGLRPITRGAWSDGTRTVLDNACGSGYDLQVSIADEQLQVQARYRPMRTTLAANVLLSERFGLLAGQTLVHYPAIWRAGWRGRAPLHAAVFTAAGRVPMLAGPGGVGKSTVIGRATGGGASTTADNLCVGDGSECFGLSEPLRLAPEASDPRLSTASSQGRSSTAMKNRVESLLPDRLVVLERGVLTELAPVDPQLASEVLVAGTYAAGELRRYWQFCATLALATGIGPAHPPVSSVAREFASRLPCIRVRVGDGEQLNLHDVYGGSR